MMSVNVTITPVIYDGIHRDSYRVLGQHLLGFDIENCSFFNFEMKYFYFS